MSYNTVRTTQEEGIVHAVLDANELNVVDWRLMLDLNDLIDKWTNDESVKVIVFESAVKDFFSAHMDIRPDPGQLTLKLRTTKC